MKKRSLLILVGALGCVPTAPPLKGVLAPDRALPSLQLATGHRQLVFKWEYQEGDIAARVVSLDAFRQQAIECESLVIAARHQALDHKAPDLLNGEAANDQGIEAVEGSEDPPDQPPTLRRIGIGVGHMREVGRKGRCAVHRQRVAFGRLCFAKRRERRYTQREGDTRQHTQTDTPADGQRRAGI